MARVIDARARFRAPGLASTRPTTPEAYDRAAAALAGLPPRRPRTLAEQREVVNLCRQRLAAEVARLAALESDDGESA